MSLQIFPVFHSKMRSEQTNNFSRLCFLQYWTESYVFANLTDEICWWRYRNCNKKLNGANIRPPNSGWEQNQNCFTMLWPKCGKDSEISRFFSQKRKKKKILEMKMKIFQNERKIFRKAHWLQLHWRCTQKTELNILKIVFPRERKEICLKTRPL